MSTYGLTYSLTETSRPKELSKLAEFILTPLIATILFVLACFAGYQYRRVWVKEGPRWQLWLFGLIAGVCLALVAFIPLSSTS